MLSIDLYREQSSERAALTGFHMTGHADFGPNGKDILCAATTVLGIACVNGITELVGLKEKSNIQMASGNLELRVDYENLTQQEKHDVGLFLDNFLLNIKSLEEQYPDYMKINDRR